MELTPLQQKFIAEYKKTPLNERFYLTGGTLLAVAYLDHRRSLDLDFFANEPFTLSNIEHDVKEAVKEAGIDITEFRRVADRFEWQIKDTDTQEDTKVEFVFYDFKPINPHVAWNGILVDDLEDIAANKVFALLERHEPKDIYDLYFIIKKTKWGIKKLLQLEEKKFELPIALQTFFAQAEIALKRLDAIRGLLLLADQQKQDELFETIHDYFDHKAWKLFKQYWFE